MSTIIANINTYTENNSYAFDFFDCNALILIPAGISFDESNLLIRDPYN
jgi:hypothetical protein